MYYSVLRIFYLIQYQSLNKAYRNLQIWQTLRYTYHTFDNWHSNIKFEANEPYPLSPSPFPHTYLPHAHTQCHTCNFLRVYYTHTCMKSWGQEQQRNTLNPHQILINTHMTALLKRKSLGSKVPLDLSVDQFYINSIMKVWTLKAGMQSLSWLHIVFPPQE